MIEFKSVKIYGIRTELLHTADTKCVLPCKPDPIWLTWIGSSQVRIHWDNGKSDGPRICTQSGRKGANIEGHGGAGASQQGRCPGRAGFGHEGPETRGLSSPSAISPSEIPVSWELLSMFPVLKEEAWLWQGLRDRPECSEPLSAPPPREPTHQPPRVPSFLYRGSPMQICTEDPGLKPRSHSPQLGLPLPLTVSEIMDLVGRNVHQPWFLLFFVAATGCEYPLDRGSTVGMGPLSPWFTVGLCSQVSCPRYSYRSQEQAWWRPHRHCPSLARSLVSL